MNVADLYIRSKADHSEEELLACRKQEIQLRQYCRINGIAVRRVIVDNGQSGKFDRPVWREYLQELQLTPLQGKLLFVNWDRFSRNFGAAMQMKQTLIDLGIVPEAINESESRKSLKEFLADNDLAKRR
ncbi:recombinase family protein [Pedobacter sp. ISL-68]|uniref:recombinase family protein n=1 Tax=unclassified Pedobacter TaxID=2628915 RepID=UPI001BEBA27F|nr:MULTISPECIES: recombinase family protein [unclassified Pedobacter]MBT2561716.1 recombinase family protein [Pedobacter sp. ISL-64]MBT2591104.1 recombinase family protein [Pedobacter sp. ISL-68]